MLAGTLISGLPSPVRADSTIQASGRMTVSASSLVYADLHVPRSARLSLDYYTRGNLPAPQFSRGSEFGAIVLVSRKSPSITYLAARLQKSPGAAQRFISLGPEACQLDDFCDVPAGDYRLFVVTKHHLSVEIKLEGLAGNATIRPTSQAIGELSGAEVSYFHSTPEGKAEAAAIGMGFSPEVTGKSNYIFSAFWFRGPHEPTGPPPADQPLLQVGNAGGCRFTGSPPAEAYAPGCPTGQQNGAFTSLYGLRQFKYLQWGSTANLHPGEYGQGHYAVHTGIHDPGFVGFWIDLRA